jgi:soluble lytic murein transglycosylase-like protein
MKLVALHLSRVYSLAKAGLALVGLIVVCALTLSPVERHWFPTWLPVLAEDMFAEASKASAGGTQLIETAQEREQRALAEFIARRWRVAETAATSFVSIAYRAGKKHSVDPVLVLSVMAIESRYNPVAESTVGAKGLMQVIPKYHLEKLLDHGGEEALLDPEVNIHVGAQILREYYRRLNDQEAALQMYAGAYDEPTSRYAAKVFEERMRLETVRQGARKRQSGQSV